MEQNPAAKANQSWYTKSPTAQKRQVERQSTQPSPLPPLLSTPSSSRAPLVHTRTRVAHNRHQTCSNQTRSPCFPASEHPKGPRPPPPMAPQASPQGTTMQGITHKEQPCWSGAACPEHAGCPPAACGPPPSRRSHGHRLLGLKHGHLGGAQRVGAHQAAHRAHEQLEVVHGVAGHHGLHGSAEQGA